MNSSTNQTMGVQIWNKSVQLSWQQANIDFFIHWCVAIGFKPVNAFVLWWIRHQVKVSLCLKINGSQANWSWEQRRDAYRITTLLKEKKQLWWITLEYVTSAADVMGVNLDLDICPHFLHECHFQLDAHAACLIADMQHRPGRMRQTVIWVVRA